MVTRDADDAPPSIRPSSHGLREAGKVERLAYTRRQGAEALGVSISTIDRRVVPSIDTVKLPWGQRLIPVDELERFLRSHVAARALAERDVLPAGRRRFLEASSSGSVSSMRMVVASPRSALTAEGAPTAHGGRKWWPSTVRAVLVRSSRQQGR